MLPGDAAMLGSVLAMPVARYTGAALGIIAASCGVPDAAAPVIESAFIEELRWATTHRLELCFDVPAVHLAPPTPPG